MQMKYINWTGHLNYPKDHKSISETAYICIRNNFLTNTSLLHDAISLFFFFLYKIFSFFFFISWRLITLQYCSGFCHTLKWISHGFTCVPHPDPPSHLPLRLIPLVLPSVPGPSTCLMHPPWAGDVFQPR